MKTVYVDFKTVNLSKMDPYRLTVGIENDNKEFEVKDFRFNVGDALVDSRFVNEPESSLRQGPSIVDLWPDILDLINGCGQLVCFRSGDDLIVMDRVIKRWGLDYPEILCFEAQNIARRILPLLPSYTKESIMEDLGIIPLVKEGVSVEELALIVRGCLDRAVCENLLVFCENFKIVPSVMNPKSGYKKGKMARKRDLFQKDPKAEALLPEDGTSFDPDNFFYGKNVVFTGSFENWGFQNRTLCQQIVVNIGGYAQTSLKKTTNVLVEGVQKDTKVVDGVRLPSAKQLKAREFKKAGMDIEIITGDDFYNEVFDYINDKR